ncbi:hypothetical protein M409DRAFT_29251 [Zasmidium cellare ATCC 36951]|uniref:Uncharacterized protein n=1 Tax=Zasmidium cellare ATCC 36951 TaxID=1080233 RepID=A0A6A6C0B4_ZASCE|nr:uncharacterized protein M409DRAFT_29251 [Zasmidium cellare ATCC 36951]KAF2160405.1 hypothetical protein M409DRAFT_29251 [Zasmidium cellare ATCC 36951]
MALNGVDLGQLGLASTATGLHLDLTSHAEIALPEEGSEVDPCGLTTAVKPWCRRGHEFHLSLSLYFEGDFTEVSPETLSRNISQRLGWTEQWQQLPLRPAGIVYSATEAGGASIVVHLDHSNERPPKRQLHKLEDGVPDEDRTPPPGVPAVILKSIHLSMRFSKTSCRKRRKLEPSLSECIASLPPHEDLAGTGLSESAFEQTLKQGGRRQQFFETKSHHGKCGATCRRSKTSPAPESITSDDADMLFEARSPPYESAEANVDTASAIRQRSYNTGDLRQHDDDASSNHEHLFELFDAGLRLAITSNSSRLPKGVKLVTNESFKHLADTFPALWSPGHLSALSSRAVFLPTISHALANVCGVHAQGQVLRAKLAELNRRLNPSHHGRETNTPGSEKASLSDAQGRVTTPLWETMERSLFERDTITRLKPLSLPSEKMIDDDENIWADSLGIAIHSAQDQDIDDVLSDSDESMLDETELPLTPEPGADHAMNLLWNDTGASDDDVLEHTAEHVADWKRGPHVGSVHEHEILSLCGSADSLAVDDGLDVASLRGPEEPFMPPENLVGDNLFESLSDGEMEMDEMMPI